MSSRRKNNKLVDLLSSPGGFQMTQAFTSPITSRLKGGLFNPLEFNPYLLFDAQTSMLGELEAPTLDLDASDESTLDVITATRAGVATYTDLHGTIQTASADTVRVDWSLGYPAMLIEPSATNLVEYSEDFSDSYWTNADTLVQSNQITSPDGLTNGDKLSAFNITNQGYIKRDVSVTASNTYTFSVYAKKGEQKYICLVGLNPFTASYFDLESGIALSNNAISSSIEDVGDGWFRLTATLDADTSSKFVGIYLSQTGSTLSAVDIPNGEGVYIWGAQLEAGSVATSYIPTSGGSVAERTRNADNLVIDGTAFSDFYNTAEGTIYTESVGRGYFNQNSNFAICLNNSSNDSIYQRSPSNTQTLVVIDGGSVQAQMFSATSSTGTLVRRAASFKLNNFKASQDGVDITPDTLGTMPTVNKFYIGASALGDHQLNGHIKRLIYWPTHSDNL